MQKKKYCPRASDVLGIALMLTVLLSSVFSWLRDFFDMSTGALFVKFLLRLPEYFLPILCVYLGYRRLHRPFPRLMSSALSYNESAMLTVSAFGAIVLMQTAYGALFPVVFPKTGVGETETVFGFLLLSFASVALPAVLEELFYRGVVLRALTEYRPLLAILISSLVSALMHFSVEGFPLYFGTAFLLGSVYYTTGSLGAVMGVHLMTDTVWFLSETVGVYMPERLSMLTKGLVAASALLFAFGLPFLKKTVRAILGDAHDDTVLPSSHFWSIPIICFFVFVAAAYIFLGAFEV